MRHASSLEARFAHLSRDTVRFPIKTQIFHHIRLARVRHFSGLFFFFSLGIIPRLQPHLPLGFVGGGYEQSGWCFVEACAVSCEHLTQNETLVTCLCVSRVPDAPTALVTNGGFASGVVFLCVCFFCDLEASISSVIKMTIVAWT